MAFSAAQKPDHENPENRGNQAGHAQNLGRHLGHALEHPTQTMGENREEQPLDHEDQSEAGQEVAHGAKRPVPPRLRPVAPVTASAAAKAYSLRFPRPAELLK